MDATGKGFASGIHQSPLVLSCVTGAILLGASAKFFQPDFVYRNLASSKSLYRRRHAHQRHRLKNELDKGSRSRGAENTTDECITSDDEISKFIRDIIGKNGKNVAVVVKQVMDIYVHDTIGRDSAKEYYLLLQIGRVTESEIDTPPPTQLRVPLIKFSIALSDAFEDVLTSTALCFVADASSNIGLTLLQNILAKCPNGVGLIKQPKWLMNAAILAEENIFSENHMEKVVYGLSRLEAWMVRYTVGDSRTVVITLPGQACVMPLLPILQKVFPCERHVFVYDGCTASVSRALYLRKKISLEQDNDLPPIITASTTIASLKHIRNLPEKLALLPDTYSDTIEAWMTSVSSFLDMKNDEGSNGYLPFVLRVGFLLGKTDAIGHGDVDMTDLCLRNVLQYIMGSKSRALDNNVVNSAKAELIRVREREMVKVVPVIEKKRKIIEDCIFQHKGILIGDKTLLDTVQPKKDWSLKQAKKLQSCACCAPGEGDEEDEEGIFETNRNSSREEASSGMSTKPVGFSSGFVDGKAGFAFDPSAFTGRSI